MKRKSTGSVGPPAKKAVSFADLSEESSGSDSRGNASPSDDSELSELDESDASDASDASEDETTASKPNGSSKPHKNGRIVAEDVRIARETSELFKSNIFKLQIDGLLEEIAIPEKYFTMANKVLFALRDAILASSPSKEYGVSSVHTAFPNKIPFTEPIDLESKLKFVYVAPTDVNVVGSYSLKDSVRQPEGSPIDLVVVIPAAMFEAKDYLNHRYFQKRAFYLAGVANAIANSDVEVSLRYDLLNDDPLRPILRLSFNNSKLSKYFSIVIHMGLEPVTFPARKLGDDRNCVRSVDGPTPAYNFALLCDLAYQPLLSYLHAASAQCAEFRHACQLGRLWTRQRGLQFGHFHFAVLMAALLNGGPSGKKVLLPGYSSYQLFKGMLLFLANNELDLSFQLNEPTRPAMSGGPTLELASLGLNVLQDLPSWSLDVLKHEATVGCELLQDIAVDRFQDLFLTKIDDFALQYDLHLTLSLPDELEQYTAVDGSRFSWITTRLAENIKYACGNRIKTLAFKADTDTSWALSSLPQAHSVPTIEVAVLLDAESCEKRVTYGPAPQEPGQKQFKQFWGGKSSLRRFQDGKISEAIVWRQGTRSIVYEIIEFVVAKHFDGSVDQQQVVDSVLPFSKHVQESSVTSLALWQAKINSFNELGSFLMQSEKLPLRISSIYGVSSSLRYTSIVEPLPNDGACEDDIAQGIVQLESSGKWPDDVEAIEKTKLAFLISIAEVLRKDSKYDAMVGVEPSVLSQQIETGFLLVQTDAGYVFKLRIATERDDLVYAKALEGTAHSDAVLLKLRRMGPAAADHHRLISSFALKFPFYSPAVRVLKLWFRKHLLASYVNEETIELLALKVFADSAPYIAPNSISTAFLRTLNFLGRWNWKEVPLVYNSQSREAAVSGCQMDPTAYTKATATFAAERQTDPALTLSPLFIATRADPTGILWTQSLPRSRVGIMIASRVTSLARNCEALLRSGHSPSAAFKPALQDFDVEIKLTNPSALTKPKFKNLANTSLKAAAAASNNVGLEFYHDIAHAFKDCLLLFYSGCLNDRSSRSQTIAGIWIKAAEAPQKYKVHIPYSVKPTKGGEVVLNKDAVVEEISRLGAAMVTVARY